MKLSSPKIEKKKKKKKKNFFIDFIIFKKIPSLKIFFIFQEENFSSFIKK